MTMVGLALLVLLLPLALACPEGLVRYVLNGSHVCRCLDVQLCLGSYCLLAQDPVHGRIHGFREPCRDCSCADLSPSESKYCLLQSACYQRAVSR
jgi:hypothetical protein